jgi:hypothetical protein
MSISPEPVAVRFDEDSFWVDIEDGRTLGIPLAWFPRLLLASPAEREAVALSRAGLHWKEIDQNVLVEELLTGRNDHTRRCKEVS